MRRLIILFCCTILSMALILLSAPNGATQDSSQNKSGAHSHDLSRSMFPGNWVDLIGRPANIGHVDYRRALESETISPTRVTIDTVTITSRMKESRIRSALGGNCTVVDTAAYYSKEMGNRFISDLMQKYPNTMHYYLLLDFRDIEGWLKTLEWNLSGGISIQAYLRGDSENGLYSAFLLYVTLPKGPEGSAKLSNVNGELVANRSDSVYAEWNVSTNRLTVQRK